ncbi:MAG: DUF1214 domain-containing protein, partial [Desulfobacterota bacterium]|nr:DUF1214 domain-containing protein [Thermodesulfobacteriota bacterium]
LGILLVALLLGVGSAVWVLDSFTRTKIIRDRAWTSSPLVGSVHADMYLRAFVARTALFALSKTEALYYNAFTDEDGEPLRAECDYIVDGGDVPARWWSITAYDEDHFLIPNALNRYSYHMKNLRRDEKGRYRIHLSQIPKDPNWLPSPRHGNMSLTLRAYNPAPALTENIEAAELPTIMKAGCK